MNLNPAIERAGKPETQKSDLLFLSAISYELIIAIMIRTGTPGENEVGIGRQ